MFALARPTVSPRPHTITFAHSLPARPCPPGPPPCRCLAKPPTSPRATTASTCSRKTAYLILGSTIAASASSSIDLVYSADFELIGDASNDDAGSSVSTAGDVDGDGLDDVLIGAPGNEQGGHDAGKAYVVLGSTLAASSSSTLDLGTADHQFIGESGWDYAGFHAGAAGDVDGDGLDDILIGAPYNDDGGGVAGKAYLILGRTLSSSTSATRSLSDADFGFIGQINSYAGHSVSTAGDVNGDGFDDLLIGAPREDASHWRQGKTHLLLSEL